MFEVAVWKTALGAAGVLALLGIPFMLWTRRRALRHSKHAWNGILEAEASNAPDGWEDASSRFIDGNTPDTEEEGERTAKHAISPVVAEYSRDSLDDAEGGVRIIEKGGDIVPAKDEVHPPEEVAPSADGEESAPGIIESPATRPDTPWWEELAAPSDAEYPFEADELPSADPREPPGSPVRGSQDEGVLSDEEILEAAEANQGANAPLRIRIPAVSEVRDEIVSATDAPGEKEEVEEVIRLTREREGVADTSSEFAREEELDASAEPEASGESLPELRFGEHVDRQPSARDEEPILTEDGSAVVSADSGIHQPDEVPAAPQSKQKTVSSDEEDIISLIQLERVKDENFSQADAVREEAETEKTAETADFPLDELEVLVPGEASPLSASHEAPTNTPTELIRDLVADICPEDLLLAENMERELPAWTQGVVNAAGIELAQREKTRQMPASEEHLRLAILELVLGHNEEATNHLKESLRRTSRLESVLNALAVASYLRGKVEPAISYSREALREASHDLPAQATISRNLGHFYQSKGDDEKAVEFYEKALDHSGSQGDIRQLASLHMRVGRLFRRLGNKVKAGDHFSGAAHLFHKLGDRRNEARAHTALASVLSETGDYDAAQVSLDDALSLCQKIGDKAGEALVYGQMGVSFAAQEQFTRALRYYENALRLNRGLENRKGEAANLSGMGNIHYARGDLPEAHEAYEAALEISREQGNVLAQALALGNLGRVHFEAREWEASHERLTEARSIFQEIGASDALESIANMFRELEKQRGG